MKQGLVLMSLLMAGMAGAVSPWVKLPEWHWGDPKPETFALPEFVFAENAIAGGRESWRGEEDFSARMQVGWCDAGLVIFAQVKDSEVVNDCALPELWHKDCIELFVTAPDGKQFGIGPRLQLLAAPPDAAGHVRTYVYSARPVPEGTAAQAVGRLVPGGYETEILIPWTLFGEAGYDPVKDREFRFQAFFDDWDPRDGNRSQPRIMNINGRKNVFLNPANNYLFRLTDSLSQDTVYDITPWWKLPPPPLAAGGKIVFDAGWPMRAELLNAEGNVFSSGETADGRIELPCPEDGFVRLRCYRPLADGVRGYSEVGTYCCDALLALIGKNLAADASPRDRVRALGLLSAVERVKAELTGNATGISETVQEELRQRRRQLEGADVSDAPGVLRFLNLAGDASGAVSVGISRRGNDYAAVSVTWGSLPVAYADIRMFPSEEEAIRWFAGRIAFRHSLEAPEIAGADAVAAGRGFTWGDACPWDLDISRQVSVTSDRAPGACCRVTPEEALALHPVAFTRRADAPAAQVELFRRAGIPEMTVADAAKTAGIMAHLGGEELAQQRSGIIYYHPLYGIENDTVVARAGKTVVETAYNIPENGAEVLRAILAGQPIPETNVERWRSRLAAALGGDVPTARAAGRMVRTGDVHTHTVYSDGAGTPGGLIAEAALSGMDFLVISDHGTILGAEQLAAALKSAGCGFPLIVGEEITLSHAYHLNSFPLTECIDQNQPYADLIRAARQQGAVTQLNHPMTYGTNLDDFWYGNFRGTGLDAIERRVENLARWRKTGKAPVVLGSTDTHTGIFGHNERSAILADEVDGATLAQAVRERRAGMIAPYLAAYVYGDAEFSDAVRAALSDPELPRLHAARLARDFERFDVKRFLETAPDGRDADCRYGDGDPNEVIVPFAE